ncbi:hypothetical protein MUA77_04010 [Mammaliicoccus sciuri]|uniref:hypothetical protein n=1 Tax=Mammaliicoccus sciuri TaxID=1296 RepID=UPI0021D1A773|nr:hypothetical protein [Mammaliicoccus sciuri]UXU84598.1 hypothetical protein MUA77_04010 [Mammaliicoccus sciuri]UXU94446.1 hypothetical protein MUA42_04020 [Mammaliicoccus sciuri]UXV16394.1 hypothetical protein MUA89_04015 [Mammaliicoccus sciuri]UXV24656.1 hypothetical protein MUA49_04015 [Mammaliicoccus sciuri]UXV27440.1 hypothetical protein MUA96_04015 [Mammaliicoccus sciuri]
MKVLNYTVTHIYILTNDGHQLKIINPGHKNKKETNKWLEMVASDYDKMMKDEKKNV